MYMQGKIDIRKLAGRRGIFTVGTLTVPLGQFEAKTSLLDNFDEGSYDGAFDVARIYIDGYRSRHGQWVNKLCADLADVQITHDTPAPPDQPTHPSMDPIVEAGFVADTSVDLPPDEPASPIGPTPDDDVSALFGELAPGIRAAQPVTLDPAHSKFRLQVAALKTRGYRWRPTTKTWEVPSH